MERNTYFIRTRALLLLLCLTPVCPIDRTGPKCRHESQIHQRTHRTKAYDPPPSNNTAGAPSQNCLFNSTGNSCERCKEGYYGNVADGTCRACPCPFTWNNFASACVDIGSGALECLCKRGYVGVRCERCASGFYGNPVVHGGRCKPCNCKDGSSGVCNTVTGGCSTPGGSSSCSHCHGCDSCTDALLVNTEEMDDSLVRLTQQLPRITHISGSLTGLSNLEDNISESELLVRRFNMAVKLLPPKVEQLEVDASVVEFDLSQVTFKTLQMSSYPESVEPKDLQSGAEDLLTAIQDLINQLTGEEARDPIAPSEGDQVRMMEEAHHMVEEMRERSCAVQRRRAGSERDEAHEVYEGAKRAALNQTLDSSIKEPADLLSEAANAVNLRRDRSLRRLQHLQAQLEAELLPMTEMSTHLWENLTDFLMMLEDIKQDLENHAAQLDGAKRLLFKKINNFQLLTKEDVVTTAERRAEELHRLGTHAHQVLHDATNNSELLSFLGVGAHDHMKTAEKAANQSKVAASQALQDVEGKSLVPVAGGIRDDSSCLKTDANKIASGLQMLSHLVNVQKDGAEKKKDKGESLQKDISKVRDDLKSIQRDDIDVLIESAKTSASASNATFCNITERLRHISQEVDKITFLNMSLNMDNTLPDADQALRRLKTTLPVLRANIGKVEALSRKSFPSANMMDSLRRIQDVIGETRNFIHGIPDADLTTDDWCELQRAQRAGDQLSGSNSWFSYSLPHQDLNHRPHFSLDVKTNSSRGLLLHVAGRGAIPLLALYMANGKIKMSLGRKRIIQHKQKSNDEKWHRVEFSVEQSSFHLVVDGVRVTDGHLPNKEGSTLDLHGRVYVGGDPLSKTTKGHDLPRNSISGCIRNFKFNDEAAGKPEARHQVLPCLGGFTETGTYFGGGHVVLDHYVTVGPHFKLAFELRPQRLTGLLFSAQSHRTRLIVFLMESTVSVIMNDVRVSVTPPTLCDGRFHVVTLSKQEEVVTLMVDSMSDQTAGPSKSTLDPVALDSLHIGGTSTVSLAPVSSPFLGCLRNVRVNGRLVALEAESRVVGRVSINRCPAD